MSKERDPLQQELIDAGLKRPEDFEELNNEEEEDDDDEIDNQEEKDKLADDDDEIEEDEEEDEEEDPNPKSKGIPSKVFNKTRSELREAKEAIKTLQDQLAERDAQNAPALDEEAITAAAKEMLPEDASEEQIKATEFQLKKIMELASKNSPKADDRYATLEAKIAAMEDEKLFSKEWKGFEGELRKQYPHANPKQIEEARAAMDELAHAEQFADKEFDYVHFKNKDIFDEILAKKQTKTFESRDTFVGRDDDESDDVPNNVPASKLGIDKVLKRVERMKKMAEAQDNETGWNIEQEGF